MGCFITKSSYISYQEQLKAANERLDQLEFTVNKRKEENQLEEIDIADRVDYLAYQEQLRAKKVLECLNQYIPATKLELKPSETSLITPNLYFRIRFQQTENQRRITTKLEEIIEKINQMHSEKKKYIEERINLLQDFVTKKLDDGEKIIFEINQKIHECSNTRSLENLVNSVLKLSDLQKDLELLQRRCDYKGFLLKKQERVKARIDAGVRIEELKKDIDSLNANWANMKDKQRQEAEMLQYLQDTIESNKKKFEDLSKEKLMLQEHLSQFEGKPLGLTETQEIYHAKELERQELDEKNNKLSEEIKILEESLGNYPELSEKYAELKENLQNLRSECEKLQNQKESIKSESLNSLKSEIDLKTMMIEDLSKEISEKELQITNMYEFHLKKERESMAIHLIENFNNFLRTAFNKFKFVTHVLENQKSFSEIQSNHPISNLINRNPDAQAWSVEQLHSFFDEFIKDKYKKDQLCIKENKLPKPLQDSLIVYMSTLYEKIQEAELQIAMLGKCVISEFNSDAYSIIIKKMLSLSKEPFPYHFTYFLTIAIHDFDEIQDPNTKTIPFISALQIIESYIEDNTEIGIKIAKSLKSLSISDENFMLILLFHKLSKTKQFFTDVCNYPEDFIDVAENILKVWASRPLLEAFKTKCENEFDINFDTKIELSIGTLQNEKFLVGKIEFLEALIDVYTETRKSEINDLEAMVKDFQNITEEIFTELIQRIDEKLPSEMISKMFSEGVMETDGITSMKPANFIQLVMKYGIKGYGIGHFKKSELTNIMQTLFSINKLRKKDEEVKIENKNKPIPLNILLEAPKETAHNTRIPVPNPSLLIPKKVVRLSEMRSSLSPHSQSLKNVRSSPRPSPRDSLKKLQTGINQ